MKQELRVLQLISTNRNCSPWWRS